jgi:hypothetical protein
MKKLLILILGIITSVNLPAQTKGEISIGGQIGMGLTSNLYDEGNLSFSISPEFGYFVTNRLKIGIKCGYEMTIDRYVAHLITISPNISYYIKVIDNLYYTPQLDISGVLGSDGYGIGSSIMPVGFEFRPKPQWSINFGLLTFSYYILPVYRNPHIISFNIGTSYIGMKYNF